MDDSAARTSSAAAETRPIPERPVERLTRPLLRFLRVEAASGVVLAAATAVALAFANSPLAGAYGRLWETTLEVALGAFKLSYPLWYWINDGLMTIFFFVIGLEIKRELVHGELRDRRQVALPVAAAIGGVAAPVAIFAILQRGTPALSGWAVPMATDIAFVVGCMALLGSRVPHGLKVLLLSVAIVDDILAVLVIAVFYSSAFEPIWLGAAAAGFGLVVLLNRAGVRTVTAYVLVGAGIWLATLKSGVHPTVAGVLLGLLTPAGAWIGQASLRDVLDRAGARLRGAGGAEHQLRSAAGGAEQDDAKAAVRDLSFASRESVSPLERLEEALHPWVGFVIMPVFALASAGVAVNVDSFLDSVSLSVALGLALGKPLGITLASWLVVRAGWARLPEGVSWTALIGASILGGIGFTMALFIASLGLDGDLLHAAKAGILAGSVASGVAGMAMLAVVLPRPARGGGRNARRAAAGFLLVLALPCSLAAAGEDSPWQLVPIPESWKRPPSGDLAPRGGFSWCRARVKVPESWRGRALDLFVEPLDDARQVYFDGVLVGAMGSMPPRYRSGLGEPGRFAVPPERVRPGERHWVAVRVCSIDSRDNFDVAAPVLVAGAEAIRMEGPWQYRPGDDPSWARGTDEESAPEADYAQVDAVDDVERYVRRRRGDHDAYAPEESLRRFKVAEDLTVELALAEPAIAQPLYVDFDERGRLWVLEYRQYPEPAGLKPLSRDKFLRTVFDQVPPPPPRHFRGLDRVSFHEDADGDGDFERHGVFVDGLSIATSFARGRGGVWVLNPPYLLFYPDRDADDAPDGDPELHLEGFGLEDTHSVTNNLRWGPDGWLYAAQGSTVSAQVRRPGAAAPPVATIGQLIWRYQPESRRYEVFAEGGGNAFGVEIDAKGRVFSGHNGGDTRGFHYVQGGYYRKGFEKHGALSNPHAFGFFEAMAHHAVERFTHAFVIYEAEQLPERYRGQLLGIEPLQGRVVLSEVGRDRSSFRTRDLERPLTTDDQWFRPAAIALGLDGAVYVADFHEQRIDHSSHYAGRVARDTGRIWRLRARASRPAKPPPLAGLPTAALIERLRDSNRRVRQEALRLLGDRRDAAAAAPLRDLVRSARGPLALDALWALHLSGGFDDANALDLLSHPEAQVRAWTVRLLGDRAEGAGALASRLAELARAEPDIEVRVQLAATARRLPAAPGLALVRALLAHDQDAYDIHQPLMLWWAVEARCGFDREAVLALLEDRGLWQRPLVRQSILERLMRRFAAAGSRAELLACARLLDLAPDEEAAKLLLAGFEKAFQGRALASLPEALGQAIERAGGGSPALRLRRGDAAEVERALATIADESAQSRDRIERIEVLGEIRAEKAPDALLAIVSSARDASVRAAAVAALGAFDAPRIGEAVAALVVEGKLGEARDAAVGLLASRRPWAQALLAACASGRIDARSLPEWLPRRLFLHGDAGIARQAAALWGEDEEESGEALRSRAAELRASLAAGAGNPYKGRGLFRERCGRCHALFGEGGGLGPDLTSARRDDLEALLRNLIDPDAEIREGYENVLVSTGDGQVLNGLVVDEDANVLVLRSAEARNAVIPKSEVRERRTLARSLMPAGALDGLDEQGLRDLFAYLRASQPLP
jgi:Na+/H+ antiporter NhaA